MAPDQNLSGKPVTVVGLGVEGIDLVRYLSAHGARVTVSDSRSALRDALDAIADTGATLSLGANRPEDITGADAVFVSQGVPPDLPALRAARSRGVPISSMTRLFLEQCPAPVAGVTGSSGKTTTVALIGDLTHSEEAAVAGLESDTATITARLSVPLYQSGSQHSKVRQLRQTNNQRRIEVEESRRAVIEDVTQAWERLNTATARIRSRADQVAAAELALDGVRQEAEVGSRTVLDVLDAEQELLDARVALVAVERDEYVAGFDLRAAVGRLTAEDLGLPVEVYDPTDYYRAVRNKLIGTSVDSQ